MRTKLALSILLFTIVGSVAHAQGTWTTKANVGGGGRLWGVGFSVGHRAFIGLGANNVNLTGALQDFWEYDVNTNAWTQRANFPGGPRKGAVAFVVNNSAYVGTGADANSVQKNDLWQYTPSTNTWVVRASLGGLARDGAVAFGIGGFGYLGTGRNGTTALNDFWRYDANANQWTQRPNFGGGSRHGAAAFVVNGFGYVGTGLASVGGLKKDLWRYSPGGNNWSQMPDMTGSVRFNAIGYSVGNGGYIAGGTTFSFLQDVWRFEPTMSQWTQQSNLPIALALSTSFAVAGKAYVGSGAITGSAVSNFYEFTPTYLSDPVGTWTPKSNFGGSARRKAVGFSIGSKGYIGTGYLNNGNRVKDFWEYDPNTDAWSQKAPFGGEECDGAVGFSIGSRGYVGTGSTGGYTGQFWEYNPVANAWAEKADCSGRRYATGFSIGPKGYIGTGDDFNDVTTFFEYDPGTDTWTLKANFGGSARSRAVGFSIGSKGYIGTGFKSLIPGGPQSDFWEYDPTTNAWSQKANLGVGLYDAVGFSIGLKGYISTGANANSSSAGTDRMLEYDPSTNTWTQQAIFGGGRRDGAAGFSIGSKGYMGTGYSSSTSSFVNDFWEYDPGVVTNCSANRVTLSLNTDAFGSETTWEITTSGSNGLTCNGSGYASNSTISVDCCLPNGCYDLRVFDSFGDGILSPGGYVLKDASNQRIIDNVGNGAAFTTVSQVTNGDGTAWSFCVPIGTDALVASSCDQTFSLGTTVVVQVQANPTVTAQLGVGDQTDDGYQICIFDPHGGFRRNVFQSFAAPGTAFPTGTANALKPTFFNLNFTQAPFPPTIKLLNVRVRSKVNGVFTPCGPTCRMFLFPPTCTTTKLTTAANPQISCGAQNVSVNGGQLFCDLVSGANRYQFQFAGPNNYLRNVLGPAAAMNSLASRTLTLGVFQQQPLPCGVPLTVRVRASFDGGATFCPFGPDCSISVTGCPVQLRAVEDDASTTGLSIWPNPSDGGRLNIRLDGIDADLATVELADAYGKFVRRETLTGTGSGINTVLDLGGDIAEGLYFVTITAGGESFTERVMIVR